jgi:hypothetical protein
MLRFRSVKYFSQTRDSVELPSLFACIGERIRIEIEAYTEMILISSKNVSINFAPSNGGGVGTLEINNIIKVSNNFFKSAYVGDFIYAYDWSNPSSASIGTYEILEKFNDSTVRVDGTFIIDGSYGGSTGDNGYIAIVTDLKALLAKFAITNGGYNSLTTTELQSASWSNETPIYYTGFVNEEAKNIGRKEWQTGYFKFTGNDITSGHQQSIIISNEIIVTPLFLAGQLADLQASIMPSYFKKTANLKYRLSLGIGKSETDILPENTKTIETGTLGWFNQKYNGENPAYSLTSLSLLNGGDSVNTLQFSNEITVIAVIAKSGTDVTTLENSCVFGFNYLPQDSELYTNSKKTLEENYRLDSKLCIVDDSPVVGEYNGTANQIIKTLSCEKTGAKEITVTATIQLGANVEAYFRANGEAWYNMWLILEDTSVDYPICDKTSLLLQVEKVTEQLVTIDLLECETVFIEHPYEDSNKGEATLEMFPTDDVVANSLVTIDFDGHENEGILIRSCEAQIVLTHATEADIVLERFNINFDGSLLVGSSPAIQNIVFSKDRGFKVSQDSKKKVVFGRDSLNDSGTIKAFSMSYPFFNRWEYWLKLLGVSSISSDMFDSSLEYNGINHFWNRLVNTSGWSMKYRQVFTIQQNGELFEQTFNSTLTSTGFNSNTDWSNCTIKSYDVETNSLIEVGAKKYIHSGKDTKIVASFEKTSGAIPDETGFAVVLWAENYEGGGVTEITQLSSVYEKNAISWFKSLSNDEKVQIAKSGAVFTGSALIDYSKLPKSEKVTIYARIYEISDGDFNARITNDLIIRDLLNGEFRIII